MDDDARTGRPPKLSAALTSNRHRDCQEEGVKRAVAEVEKRLKESERPLAETDFARGAALLEARAAEFERKMPALASFRAVQEQLRLIREGLQHPQIRSETFVDF